MTIILQRGVASLENGDFNSYVYITMSIDYYKLYREYTVIICNVVYRKKFCL